MQQLNVQGVEAVYDIYASIFHFDVFFMHCSSCNLKGFMKINCFCVTFNSDWGNIACQGVSMIVEMLKARDFDF